MTPSSPLPASQPSPGHPDYILLSALRDEIAARGGGIERLTMRFPELVRDAVDFVLDPVRTARTRMNELDNVEKTFIGLKLEHFLRDYLDVPKGLRDLVIMGKDVDIKNTVNTNWSIPQETYNNSEPCVLMRVDETLHKCHLGLIVAKPEYLHGGKGNRDTKKGVSAQGSKNILWLVSGVQFRPSRFIGLDMSRFRELRKKFKGNERVAQFCRENLRRIVHREVMQALLFDQNDYMKRLRSNGGAPDILMQEETAILIGTYQKDRDAGKALGISLLRQDEIVPVKARSMQEAGLMRGLGLIK